jgi:hypothetical protein
MMTAFLIWLLAGAAFVALGIYDFCSKKERAFGFFSNAKVNSMRDVRGYNRALGKLWIVFGLVFTLLGFPLLSGQNSPYAMISVVGAAFETVAAMAFYIIKIEGKYREK